MWKALLFLTLFLEEFILALMWFCQRTLAGIRRVPEHCVGVDSQNTHQSSSCTFICHLLVFVTSSEFLLYPCIEISDSCFSSPHLTDKTKPRVLDLSTPLGIAREVKTPAQWAAAWHRKVVTLHLGTNFFCEDESQECAEPLQCHGSLREVPSPACPGPSRVGS